jgi:hypothetical protein
MHKFTTFLALISCLFFSSTTNAKVSRVKIDSAVPVLNGKVFGPAGAYQLLKGTIYFTFDPDNPFNENITDIKLAEKNADGQVEAWGDLVVLKPLDPEKGSDVTLVEVSNRGGKFTPSYFNGATKGRELDPNDPDYWGDGLLMQQGMTVIWIGWQWDVPEGAHNLKLNVPVAKNENGSSITGFVRSDWTIDKATSTLGIGHRNLEPYPAINLNSSEHRLAVRDGRNAKRILIDHSLWHFGKKEDGKIIPSDRHIYLEPEFEAGKIYELVYRAKDPPVVGLGLLAIRDVISYAKYDAEAPFKAKKGIAAGVSQTGRFLRHFLYQGFNTDEEGRQAYDGMMIITAGAGRGSFNHRFAQPSRDAHRYSAFFYPTDLFPFTSRDQKEPDSGMEDGLLSHMQKEAHKPKIFYINTGYEYWGRAASLIHTSPDGKTDVAPLAHERIFHLAGAQHFQGAFPPPRKSLSENMPIFRGNPMGFKVNYRALLMQMLNWVDKDVEPSESLYPMVEEKDLVEIENISMPEIPDFEIAKTIHVAYQADYGPRWKDGIVDFHPPRIKYAFQSRASQVNELGNERAGIQNVELRVPLATYTPWNVRQEFAGGADELIDFRGTFIPLPKTEAEKKKNKDPRPSIESLYKSKEDYLKKVGEAAQALVKEGFLLEADIEKISARNEAYWDWIMKQ